MPRSAVTEFVRLLNAIDPSKHRSEVFRDFCELTYCALAKAACPIEAQRQALETQYMGVVKRYRNKDDIRKMPELVGLALGKLSNGGCDFFGMVAGEIGALDAKLGQFFTPYEVSRFMAELTLVDVASVIEANGFVTIQEPAAGAGGMLLAAADSIEAMGFDLATQVWIEATELSRSTYHMAYIQISARGLAGRVICGNSLSLDVTTSAYTAHAPVFWSKHGDPFAKQKIAREAAEQAEAEQLAKDNEARVARLHSLPDSAPTTGAVQLGLFDF